MFGRRFIPKIAAFFPTGTMNNSISRSRNAWLLTGQYNKYASSAKSKRRSKDRLCWKCSAILKSAVEFFCPSCNIIQRPSKTATYFELLNRWKRLFDDLCVTSANPPAADGGGDHHHCKHQGSHLVVQICTNPVETLKKMFSRKYSYHSSRNFSFWRAGRRG